MSSPPCAYHVWLADGYRNRSYRELALDDGRARALQDASDKARNARRTISQELQRMEGTSAEGPRASRYAPLKENMRRGVDLSTISLRDRPWNDSGSRRSSTREQALNERKPWLHAIVLDFASV